MTAEQLTPTNPLATGGRSTMTDPRAKRGWHIGGEVIQLREHATDRVYRLPDPPRACTLGTTGELQVIDATGTVSRAHAELEPVEVDGQRRWKLRDLQSKNGLRIDEKLLTSCLLDAGSQVSLGSLRLLAESEPLLGLLAMLRRLLGWASARQEYVDEAVQSLRIWAAQRSELLVIGDGDLLPVARRLHRLVAGEDVSLVSGPSGGDAAAMVRGAANGTLCIQVGRQPDAMTLVERWRERDVRTRPRLILCAATQRTAAPILELLERSVATIDIPSPASRLHERETLVQAYAAEAARELRLTETGLTPRHMEWLCAFSCSSLAEIEKTTLRVVAVCNLGFPEAATRLGFDESTLRSWTKRRGLQL